jgi:hypothetical protein
MKEKMKKKSKNRRFCRWVPAGFLHNCRRQFDWEGIGDFLPYPFPFVSVRSLPAEQTENHSALRCGFRRTEPSRIPAPFRFASRGQSARRCGAFGKRDAADHSLRFPACSSSHPHSLQPFRTSYGKNVSALSKQQVREPFKSLPFHT